MAKTSKPLIPTIPIEIFSHHIFLKSPIKSLSRFKCVCKQWNNLLRDPEFIKLHLCQATQLNFTQKQKLLLYSHKLHRFYILDQQRIRSNNADHVYADHVYAGMLKFPLRDFHSPPKVTVIVGSVNGLVCLWLLNCDCIVTIIVWNPSTRDYIVLPRNLDVPVKRRHLIGFGYDSIADDYKVLRIVVSKNSRIDLYSLRTKSWKNVMRGLPNFSTEFQNCRQICSVDGSFYWLGTRDSGVGGWNKVQFIACLNLNSKSNLNLKEESKDISNEIHMGRNTHWRWPNDNDDKNQQLIKELTMPSDFDTVPGYTDLRLLGECLTLCKLSRVYNAVVMWRMKKKNDDKIEEKWDCWDDKVMITEESFLKYGILEPTMLLPICFLKDGKILLRMPRNSSSKLLLYDPETKSIADLHNRIYCIYKTIEDYMEHTLFIEDPLFSQDILYVESLVSPNFMC